MLVRDFQDGLEVDQVLLVRGAEARAKRDGGEFLRLTLADRTGSVVAMIWEDVERVRALCPAGAPIHVRGRFARASALRPADRSRRPARAASQARSTPADAPRRPAAAGRSDGGRPARARLHDPGAAPAHAAGARARARARDTWELYRRAPAAKHYHQAYEHGLLEHCLSVAQGVSAISATFPGIDRDVAVTGALLHDIGKLEAYTTDPAAIDLTDAGRLQGEIPLGYYRVRREIEEIDGFPPRLAEALLHIILSHHGTLEHGSPGRPVHARGHARALPRQPRRPARLVRPPREGAARRRRLVGLRPRPWRQRLLRRDGQRAT